MKHPVLTGKEIVPGQLDGIDGSTVTVDEVIRLTEQKGLHVTPKDPKELVRDSLAPGFKNACYDRMDAIFNRASEQHREKYEAYHMAHERLEKFLEENMTEAAYKAYRELFVRLESDYISPWELIKSESTYFSGVRDGMAMAEILISGSRQ